MLCFTHKTCFEGFSAQVPFGSKIAIIGDNGSGKSTLLKALAGQVTPMDGTVEIPPGLTVGYVPQTVYDYPHLSGGQRFNKKLSEALALRPDVLLLDEPTNHLDLYNRRSLMNMLDRFSGTLIVVSHDVELLRAHVDRLWHISDGQIIVFSGKYDDYLARHGAARLALETEKDELSKEKRRAHQQLMKEQQRAAKSRQVGELNRQRGKWAPIVAGGKERQAQVASGKKNADIGARRQDVNERLRGLFIPELLTPSFSLACAPSALSALFISAGTAGYAGQPVLSEINLTVGPTAKVALLGGNGAGKSTLLRAVMGDPAVQTFGLWERPPLSELAYLDQHYAGPEPDETALQYVARHAPGRTHAELRKHLNDFLFRKNEEVNAPSRVLSGGERARLALAALACRVPRLLILDEITNNLDLRAKEHVQQVLLAYPGALLIVSHEPDFLRAAGVQEAYLLADGRTSKVDLDALERS